MNDIDSNNDSEIDEGEGDTKWSYLIKFDTDSDDYQIAIASLIIQIEIATIIKKLNIS